MIRRRAGFALWFALSSVAACRESTDPSRISAPQLQADDAMRHTVIADPAATGNGFAATMQEGIAMVSDGGMVLVKPGTYDERVVIDKGR